MNLPETGEPNRPLSHDPPGDHRERTDDLTITERSLVRRLISVARFGDFMAILMVAATAFSAFATWRTAEVTSRVFAMEDRPFIGVLRITFEQSRTLGPRAVVEYQNFGKLPASAAIISVSLLAEGKKLPEIADEMSSISAGILSPGVPHFFYRYMQQATYDTVVAGKVRLMVYVRAEYKGALSSQFCYAERFAYDFRSESFRPAGGTDQCTNSDVF